MAQRVLAVAGAVAMVLVAIVIRSFIDDDGSSDPSGDGSTVIACAADLAEACRALDGEDGVTVVEEPAADTAARIVAGTFQQDGIDGWVTTSAWLEVIEARRAGAVDETTPFASSPVVVATDPVRTSAVQGLCDGRALWRCLGDSAGADWSTLDGGDQRWGALKTGLPDAGSASGLPVLASVASGHFGDTDFASNDFAQGFSAWLATLAEPSQGGDPDPVATLVTTRGKYTAVGGLGQAARDRDVDALDPEPEVRAVAVLIALRDHDALPGVRGIREALVASGWEPVDADAPVAPTLKPGVMAALHTLWTEVNR